MNDRDEVIRELQTEIEDAIYPDRPRRFMIPLELAEKALELLKVQEPMLVKHTTSTIRCPKCNKQITSRGAIHNEIKYCWKCGQAVKWE